MINEKFAEGSSLLHRLDPRIKLIVSFIITFVTAIGINLMMLVQVFVLSILLLLLAQLNIKSVCKQLFLVNFFIILIWFIIPFTYPGESIFQLGHFIVYREGIIYAAKITLRSNTIMLIIISLLSTSTISSLIHAMNNMYLSDKLIYLFFFVYRYLHVIKDEYDRIYNSMLMRGFKPGSNIHTYKSYAYLIAMLLIKSYERSKKVYEAMLCRAFKGKFYIIDNFSIKKIDILFSALSFIVILWFIIIEKGWIII